MTPEQHAVRAQELAAEAEQTYADIRGQVEVGDNIDEPVWRYLDTTLQLGQLHATLALKPTAPGRHLDPSDSFVNDDSHATGSAQS